MNPTLSEIRTDRKGNPYQTILEGEWKGRRIAVISGGAPRIQIPFNASAREHVEGPWSDTALVPTTGEQNLLTGAAGEVPAYPYLKAIVMRVTTTGGVLGPGVAGTDFPWSTFSSLQLSDANGTALFGAIGIFSGYDTFLANKYGGYAFMSDPAGLPGYTNGPIAYSFDLRVPVQYDPRTGAGALGNMAANAPFRLQVNLNTIAGIYAGGTAPTTPPSVRLRCYSETWTLPPAQNIQNTNQEQLPPGGLGTTQYWRKTTFTVPGNSQFTVKLTDLGNLIRTWVLIVRGASNARLATTQYPDPFTLAWDQAPLITEYPGHRQNRMAESLVGSLYNTAVTVSLVDAGVLVYSFADPNGSINGGDGANKWLPTLQSTRMEFSGTWGGSVLSLDVLTNSIAAVETAQPFSFGSASGQLVGPAQPSTRL